MRSAPLLQPGGGHLGLQVGGRLNSVALIHAFPAHRSGQPCKPWKSPLEAKPVAMFESFSLASERWAADQPRGVGGLLPDLASGFLGTAVPWAGNSVAFSVTFITKMNDVLKLNMRMNNESTHSVIYLTF